jgi:hypothetical protein
VVEPHDVGDTARVVRHGVPPPIAGRAGGLQRPRGCKRDAAVQRSRDADLGMLGLRAVRHHDLWVMAAAGHQSHSRRQLAAQARVTLDSIHPDWRGKAPAAIATHGHEHVRLPVSRLGAEGHDHEVA